MTVAGLPVTPQFVGIPYGLVGETQVNFQVPVQYAAGHAECSGDGGEQQERRGED